MEVLYSDQDLIESTPSASSPNNSKSANPLNNLKTYCKTKLELMIQNINVIEDSINLLCYLNPQYTWLLAKGAANTIPLHLN